MNVLRVEFIILGGGHLSFTFKKQSNSKWWMKQSGTFKWFNRGFVYHMEWLHQGVVNCGQRSWGLTSAQVLNLCKSWCLFTLDSDIYSSPTSQGCSGDFICNKLIEKDLRILLSYTRAVYLIFGAGAGHYHQPHNLEQFLLHLKWLIRYCTLLIILYCNSKIYIWF